MALPCLFCPAPATSKEHLLPAGTGGLRWSRDILCGPCNQRFGQELDSVFCAQFAPINGFLGVQNRRREQLTVDGVDPSSGEAIEYDAFGRDSSSGPTEISSVFLERGILQTVLCRTQAERDEYARKLKEIGIEARLVNRSTVYRLRPEGIRVEFEVGGPVAFRAMARVALNHFAHYFGDLVRADELQPFLAYVRGEPSPAFAYYDDFHPCMDSPFRVGHKVLVGVDGETGIAYGRISLFGVVDVGVFFGKFDPPVESRAFLRHIDPLAETMRGCADIAEPPVDARTLVPVQLRQDFPEEHSPAVKARMNRLLQQLYLDTIRRNAADFATEVNRLHKENAGDAQVEEHVKGMGQWALVSLQDAAQLFPPREKSIVLNFIRAEPTREAGIHPSGVALIDRLLSSQKSDLERIARHREVSQDDVMGIFIDGGPARAFKVLADWFQFGTGAFFLF